MTPLKSGNDFLMTAASRRHLSPYRFGLMTMMTMTIFMLFILCNLQRHPLPTPKPKPDDEVHICGITAMLGTYEKSAKEPVEPLNPQFPLFLVTDQEQLLHPQQPTAWTRVRLNSSLWQEDCIKEEYVGAKNNPCDQPFLFNLAKFYKMQFYRVPEIIKAKCNVVIWFDGTIQLKVGSFMGLMADRASRGQNFVTYVHAPARNGTMYGEVLASDFYRYTGAEGWGPHQHVELQYKHYLSLGFQEKWFENASSFNESKGIEDNRFTYGMFVTCMVMFDLRRKETKQFLDCWWSENILRSTQDQVGFPFCSWKLNVPIHALPDAEAPFGDFESNPYFDKLGHGN